MKKHTKKPSILADHLTPERLRGSRTKAVTPRYRYTGSNLQATQGSNLSPEVGVSHSCLGTALLRKRTTQHTCSHNKEQCVLRARGGKFSTGSGNSQPVSPFTSKSFFLHTNREGLTAAKASVEVNQSAPLMMTSCLPLDGLLERARRLGPGLEGCPPCGCHLTSQRRIQEPRVPSEETGTAAPPKSLTRNYSQLVQKAKEAPPCPSLPFHLFNIYES